MNHRYLFCILMCCAMFYFALPKLHPAAPGLKGVFAVSWLAFAFLVFAGNFAALLFPNKYRKKYPSGKPIQNKKRMRAH